MEETFANTVEKNAGKIEDRKYIFGEGLKILLF